MAGPLRREDRGETAVIWLDRAETRNVMGADFVPALAALLDGLEAAPPRAAVWIGAGRTFSAGADPGLFGGLTPATARAFAERVHALGARLRGLPCPQIAAINGLALGGGLELAMWLDFRLAADHASLGLPEARLGIVPAWGGAHNMARLVGRGRALDLLASGRRLHAEEALAWGLVHEVLPASGLLDRALALAAELPARGAVVNAIRAGLDAGDAAALAAEARAFASCFA